MAIWFLGLLHFSILEGEHLKDLPSTVFIGRFETDNLADDMSTNDDIVQGLFTLRSC
jgi:hypothetical protein